MNATFTKYLCLSLLASSIAACGGGDESPATQTQVDQIEVEIEDGRGSGDVSKSFEVPAGTRVALYTVEVGVHPAMPEDALRYQAQMGDIEADSEITWENGSGTWMQQRCVSFASALPSAVDLAYSGVVDIDQPGALTTHYTVSVSFSLETFDDPTAIDRCADIPTETAE